MSDKMARLEHVGWRLPTGFTVVSMDSVSLLRGIIFLGIALRVASATLQGDTVTSLPGVNDQISYHALAVRVLSGHGFSFATGWWPYTHANQPTAQWSFLYTLYLAAVYALVGIHPLGARLIQAIVSGFLYPWFAWRIGRRVFGERTGLIAAVLSAVYIYFVYYAGALMTETFYILAILWAFDLATLLMQSRIPAAGSAVGTPGRWLLLGLALGIAALLRQSILLFVPFLFLWLTIAVRRRSPVNPIGSAGYPWRSLFVGLLLTTSIVVAMILPWTVRNYFAFHRFVPLNTNAGYVFFWANNPIYGTQFVPILSDQTYQNLIPPNLRDLDEATLDDALMQQGIEFVIADPGHYALLSLSRIPVYFEFWPSPDSGLASNLSRVFSFGILLPFMVFGLLHSFRQRRRLTTLQRCSITLFYAFIIIYTLIHVLSWALIRYRLPVDAILIIFAAYAIETTLTRLGVTRSFEPGKPGSPTGHGLYPRVSGASTVRVAAGMNNDKGMTSEH